MEEFRIKKYVQLHQQWNYQKNQGKTLDDYQPMSSKKSLVDL